MDGCIFGNVFLSVIQPGTIIEPHCGPTNVRHRLHLTLQTPPSTVKEENVVTLTVRGETIHWTTGKAFVFDDSLVHSVNYSSDSSTHKQQQQQQQQQRQPRIVLIVDLWHPHLLPDEQTAIRDLYPAT
jgi:aspartyl/asparaginyl beta-hydroxylase (cupin superfamily)